MKATDPHCPHLTLCRVGRIATLVLAVFLEPIHAAGPAGAAADDSAQAMLANFRRVQPPAAEEVTAAAAAAESFLTHAYAGRADEVLKLLEPPVGEPRDAGVMADGVKDFAQRHGSLQSLVLLRGRSLTADPANLTGVAGPHGAEPGSLWLFYLCTTDHGLQRACLCLGQVKSGKSQGWKVVSAGAVPLENDDWTVSEMSVNAGFAVAQRACGAAAREWEPLWDAARLEAGLLGTNVPPLPPLPPLPPWSGKPASDLAAAKTWLMSTLPGAVRKSLPEASHIYVSDALGAAVIQVRHAAGAGEAKSLLNWMQADGSQVVEPWMHAALRSKLSVAGFNHLMLCHASRFSSGSNGFEDDPLSVAIEYCKGYRMFPLSGAVTAKTFGGSLDTVVATVLERARKAPGWETDVTLEGLQRDAHLIISGDAAHITYKAAGSGTTQLIVIGSDTWLREAADKNWRKNSGSLHERIFQAVTKHILDAEAGRRHWYIAGFGDSQGDPSMGKVLPNGWGVIKMRGDNPVFGEYHLACKSHRPSVNTRSDLSYHLTIDAAGAWRLCGFALNVIPAGDGDILAHVRSGNMSRLDVKPEINAPAGPAR
ncbi:MAG: hypothetical protein NTW21_15540 [Verrucomicrobia bacterium]|nr:hypothetical protein [Verrucomicrobiota bacterium]